jgi:hypothetical protein
MRASAGRSASDNRTSPLNDRSRNRPFAVNRVPVSVTDPIPASSRSVPDRSLAFDRAAPDVGGDAAAEVRDRDPAFEHLHVIDRRRARQAHGHIGAKRRVGSVVGLQCRMMIRAGVSSMTSGRPRELRAAGA